MTARNILKCFLSYSKRRDEKRFLLAGGLVFQFYPKASGAFRRSCQPVLLTMKYVLECAQN